MVGSFHSATNGAYMSDGSVFMSGLNLATEALGISTAKVQITAYNIANAPTSSFKPARLDLADGFNGSGVHVSAIRKEGDFGAGGASESACGISGTDLATEFVHLIEAKNSFIANAKVIGALEEMSETALSIKI